MIRLIVISGFLVTMWFSWPVMGQNGEPPPPPDQHGSQLDMPPGGGVPIGSGVLWLITLAGLYGLKNYRMVESDCR